MRTAIWQRFAATGVVLYGAMVALLAGRTSLGIEASLFWGFVIAVVMLGIFAVWYMKSVVSLSGSSEGMWSLPDVATVNVPLEAALSLRRIRTLAESAYPSLRATTDGGALLLTKPGGWWVGNTTVRVQARDTDEGTELRLAATSGKLINNGIGRAMIERLVTDLASTTASR